ncbi:TatD family hydrolase [Peptoniphilus sp. GNH]|nr:TatD family hydrolase [Peptoniphilus sp. GNH]
MIDSHAHLDDERFDEDRDQVINSLMAKGLDRVYNIGADIKSSRASVELSKMYDEIYAVVGIHPHDAFSYNDEIEEELKELAKNKKVRAIGEIGLDFYYDNSPREIQEEVFKRQIELANSLDMPVVVHSREASQLTFEIIKSYKEKYPDLKFLIHCFSQSLEMMREYEKLGCYMSIGGVVTFKNAKTLKEVAREISLENLLLETDCPYLTPEPYRGRRNEPSNVKYVAEEIARLRGIKVKDLIEICDKNTLRFYGDL